MNGKSTCYKNPDKVSCVDFILTKGPLSFYKSNRLVTGLSDCQKLVLSVFKATFSKSKPKQIICKNFKKFNEEDFNQELRGKLSIVYIKVLNSHALIKKGYKRKPRTSCD